MSLSDLLVLHGRKREGVVGTDDTAFTPHHSGSFGARCTSAAPANLADANVS